MQRWRRVDDDSFERASSLRQRGLRVRHCADVAACIDIERLHGVRIGGGVRVDEHADTLTSTAASSARCRITRKDARSRATTSSADQQISARVPESRNVGRYVDINIMKRRLVGRDRLAWLVALVAVGVVLYLVLPIWLLVAAVLTVVGVPLLVRRNRRQRTRRLRRI